MEKKVKKENGIVREENVLISSDATQHTKSSFNTALVAKLGETVFFLNPKFNDLDEEGNFVLNAGIGNIMRGTVCRIDHDTIYGTNLHIKAKGSQYGAVQELFFRSFKEAAEVAIKVNKYTDAHPIWEEGSWYEIYKGLFQPSYHYTLKFPLLPMQIQKVWLRRSWHYIIPNRVVARIEKDIVRIEYQGGDTKSHERQELVWHDLNHPKEYEIVPREIE